jgi:hypothetical protein
VAGVTGTLYTFAGTGAATFRPLFGDLNQFDMQVADGVDQTRWTVVPIDYPGAHMPWDGSGSEVFTAGYTIQSGCQQGAANAVAAINATPGPFAFSAYSLGCVVAAMVYAELQPGGALASRVDDFLGAVTFGSPVRQATHTIPGGTDPGGHGAMGSAYRMTATPASWWDFANSSPLDPVTTTGDDLAGQDFTQIVDYTFTTTGVTEYNSIVGVLTSGLPSLSAQIPALWQIASELFFPFLSPNSNAGAHLNYAQNYNGLPGTGVQLSAVTMAINYINSIAPPEFPAPVKSLQTLVRQDDAFVAIKAAEQAAHANDNIDASTIVVEIYDYLWRPIGEAVDRISLQAATPRNEVPTIDLALKYYDEHGGINHLVPAIRKCRTQVVGVTIEVRGQRLWSATVDTSTVKLENSQKTLTAKCLGIYDILNYMTVWPEWAFPIWFQGPLYYAIYIGPLCTCIETMVAEQALRIQFGLNEFINNAVSLNPDMRAWFGTWYASNGNIVDMLTTPVYVVHHNPGYDSSPTVTFNARMDTCKALIDKATKSYGVVCTMDLWLPGDPQPDEWATLEVPTYVFRCTDRQGITGPTGGWLDGLLSQAVNFEGSVLGDVLDPWLNPTGEYSPTDTLGIYIAPALGLNFVKPWAVLIDSPDGPMESMELVDHAPQAWQIIIGGQSPQVGAPSGNWGGTDLDLTMDERPDQRVLRVHHRHVLDSCWNYRLFERPGRPVQQHGPRFPADRELRPAPENGAVRQAGKVHRDRRRTVRRRRPVHLHLSVLGHQRLLVGDRHLAGRTSVLAGL